MFKKKQLRAIGNMVNQLPQQLPSLKIRKPDKDESDENVGTLS